MRLLFTSFACLILFSCNKYEDGPAFSLLSAKNRLDGEWEVTKINNSFSALDNSNLIWQFEEDGDFTFDASWIISLSFFATPLDVQENLVGDWEFDNNKEEIEISLDTTSNLVEVGLLPLPSPYIPHGEFNILRLTNHELWLEIDTNRIELEKIN